MAESPESGDEKGQKSRSSSSILIFLFVLIVVLAFYGNQSIHRETPLSQDQYLHSLYTGRIETQTIKGTDKGSNVIQGTRSDPGSGIEGFKVQFADVERYERVFQQLKAVREFQTIDERAFLQALDGAWYVPVEARLLTTFRRKTPSTTGAERPEEARSAPKPEREHKLIVQVMAKSRSAWDRAHGQDPDPGFPLDDQSGAKWLDVRLSGVEDLNGLLGRVEAFGVTPERLTLDLTPNQGSYWGSSSSVLSNLLIYIGPWILILVVFFIFMRQMRAQGGAGGVMSFGRSRAQLYSKDNHTNVTFDDVAGMQEAKAEVRELVEFLKNPGRFTRIGGRIPRGVLLVGAPGCGKTLLAKAIAGEAEVPFFSISGSDFVEMFVGVGASRVRDLFKQARENSPCIIFLDEIDAVGRRRGSGMGGGHDEREQTLNAILVEMDGFGTDKGIIVVAATNRPDVLDPALLRPGRFDREVTIDMPDLEGRKAIIEVHLKRVKSAEEVDAAVLARSTPGYSGADLAAIVNEAAIMAVLEKKDEVRMEHLEEARDKVRYGRQRKSQKVEEEDRKITAVHEAGHAIVAASIDEVDPPHKITIIPRGRSLGSTMMLPEKESYHMQRRRLFGQLAVLFGGRVAESEFCGDISAGASDDIKRATDLARAMVTELGMSDRIGPINYAERQGSDFLGTELMRGKLHSEETARRIDEEVQKILGEAYDRAVLILREKRTAVERLSRALLAYETITGEEVEKLLSGTAIEDLRPAPQVEPAEKATRPAPESKGERKAGGVQGDLPGTPGFSPA